MIKNDPREQPGRVSGMFGRISRWYDFLNHFLSLGMDIVWRRKLVSQVRPGTTGRFLDLAAGTMDVTCELKRRHPRASVLAMDFSRPMLQQGRPKLKGMETSVQPVLADGRSLPLPQKSVDAVTIAFGIRNIRPREAAYGEILRVLAPGGRLAILEFGTSRRPIWKGLYNFYLHTLLPQVGRVVSRDKEAYAYLAETIADFPTAEALETELSQAGFVNVSHQPLLSGIVNIHVAERPAVDGDTFILAPEPEVEPTPEPFIAPEAVLEPEPPRTPADKAEGEACLTRRAANIEAGLTALDKAVTCVKKAAAKPAAKKTSKKPAAKKAASKKTAAKKTATAKAAAKKAEPKSAAKKTAAKATTAKKTTPKKATSKAAGKKTTAKKPAAKKATGKKKAPPKKAAGKTKK